MYYLETNIEENNSSTYVNVGNKEEKLWMYVRVNLWMNVKFLLLFMNVA